MATNECQIILPQSATTLGRQRSKLAVKTCLCRTVVVATNECQAILPQSATTLGRQRSKLAVKTCLCRTVLVATNACQIILPHSATALGRQRSKLAVKTWLSVSCLVVTKYLRQYATSAGFECNIINGAWIGCLTCIFLAAENYPGGLCSEFGILVVRSS